MKKILALVLAAIFILLPMTTAGAIDISSVLEDAALALSREDMKLNKTLVIDDWGEITLKKFEQNDTIRLFYNSTYSDSYPSGNESDYAVLYVDIINNALTPHDYLAEKPEYSQPVAKVIYDGSYVYEGWAYQINRDWDNDGKKGVKPDLNYAIDPMYAGHYMFGCTLPNAVLDSKRPLQMIFIIDGMEFTYNIRK